MYKEIVSRKKIVCRIEGIEVLCLCRQQSIVEKKYRLQNTLRAKKSVDRRFLRVASEQKRNKKRKEKVQQRI